MAEKIKISIIIPVCNAEKYLEQCLESAVLQTIEPKEILCIDDGSTDRTSEILEQYASEYSFLHYRTQKNQGAGSARNHALRLAKGEFIAFLDADDFYVDATALEKMYVACKENRTAICGSLLSKISDGQLCKIPMYRALFRNGETGGTKLRYRDCQSDYHYISYIYSRRMLNEHDISFPLYRRYQDPPFFVKAMLAAGEFYVLPVELYRFRENKESLHRKNTYVADMLRGIMENLKTAIENDLQHLHNITAERIEREYDEAIIKEAFANDFEVLDLLREINREIRWEWYYGSGTKELKPLSALKNTQNGSYDAAKYEEIKESHKIISIWLKAYSQGNSIGEYLKDRGIKNIAIYGYGFLGEMLYRGLQKTDIEIKYVIDQKKIAGAGIRIISPDTDWEKVDAVIISPLAYQEILDRWSCKFTGQTLILKHILMSLEE